MTEQTAVQISGFRARLFEEQAELTARTEKLNTFIASDGFDGLPEVDRKDLKEQYKHMMEYLNVINKRVNRTLG